MSSVLVQIVALDAAARALSEVAALVASASIGSEDALLGVAAAVPGSAAEHLADQLVGEVLSVLAVECTTIAGGLADAAESYRQLEAGLVDALGRSARPGVVPQ